MPFSDYQLPEAALALKQGVGRLIRSEDGRGRGRDLRSAPHGRGYGRALLASLPPMPAARANLADRGDRARLRRQVATEAGAA